MMKIKPIVKVHRGKDVDQKKVTALMDLGIPLSESLELSVMNEEEFNKNIKRCLQLAKLERLLDSIGDEYFE